MLSGLRRQGGIQEILLESVSICMAEETKDNFKTGIRDVKILNG
jgi:hypothetical protein